MFDGKFEEEPCQGSCACSCSKTASESAGTDEKREPLYESESEDDEGESVVQNGTCGTNDDALLDLEDLGSVVQNLHQAKVQWSTPSSAKKLHVHVSAFVAVRSIANRRKLRLGRRSSSRAKC